jgi:hypothetical protein
MNKVEKEIINKWLEERLDVALKKSLRQGDEDLAKYWDTHYNIVDSLISSLSLEKEASKCACNECECVIKDDYTKEGGTCEECFRECVSTEGGSK